MSNKDELRPCPFCGAENTDVGFIAHTDDCYLMRRYIGASSRKELGIAWNTRPIEDELRAELEKRTAELHYANTACMEMKHELDRLNAEIKTTDDLLKEATETIGAGGAMITKITDERLMGLLMEAIPIW